MNSNIICGEEVLRRTATASCLQLHTLTVKCPSSLPGRDCRFSRDGGHGGPPHCGKGPKNLKWGGRPCPPPDTPQREYRQSRVGRDRRALRPPREGHHRRCASSDNMILRSAGLVAFQLDRPNAGAARCAAQMSLRGNHLVRKNCNGAGPIRPRARNFTWVRRRPGTRESAPRATWGFGPRQKVGSR